MLVRQLGRRRSERAGSRGCCSRGGLTTKIHALVDVSGSPITLAATLGQTHDLVVAPKLPAQADPQAIIAHKAFDTGPFIDPLVRAGVEPVI
jgi:hypothetical protein